MLLFPVIIAIRQPGLNTDQLACMGHTRFQSPLIWGLCEVQASNFRSDVDVGSGIVMKCITPEAQIIQDDGQHIVFSQYPINFIHA